MSEEALEYVIRIRGGSEGAAEIRKVDDALGSTSDKVKGVGNESEKATKKLSGAAGGIRSVGKALFAAGAGFVAWEAGKKAFDFTEELVKSTKQLTAATGMSTAESSRWAGVTAAVGGNAGQSAMAFQKLASASEKQTLASHKQIAAHKLVSTSALAGTEPLERLGISTAYLEKHQHNLGPVMETVVDKIHKMGDATAKGSVLTTLFGRGWKQLSPILLEGKEHLDGLLNTAKEMGVELKGNSADALEQLREKQIRASLATEALRLRFTELAAKPMGDLLQGFSALTLAITKNEWGKFNTEAVKIGETFTKIAEVILPHVAESFGHMAPVILKAFAHGFASASLGGEAVIAAVLLTKLGLTKSIFTGLATMLGNSYVGAFRKTATAGVEKSAVKSAEAAGAEDAAFAAAGKSAGLTFSEAFGAALPVAAAAALGYSAYVVGKTAFGGNGAEPFGNPYGKSSEKHGYTAKERAHDEKLRREPETTLLPNGEAVTTVGGKVVKRTGANGRAVPKRKAKKLTEEERHEGAYAHTSVRDIHVNIDGRKLFKVNARQALEAQAAGE